MSEKSCVITGAADGIGRALAVRFGQAGYAITGIDVDGKQAACTQAELAELGISNHFVIADLTQPQEWVRVAQACRKAQQFMSAFTMRASVRWGPLQIRPLTAKKQSWISTWRPPC